MFRMVKFQMSLSISAMLTKISALSENLGLTSIKSMLNQKTITLKLILLTLLLVLILPESWRFFLFIYSILKLFQLRGYIYDPTSRPNLQLYGWDRPVQKRQGRTGWKIHCNIYQVFFNEYIYWKFSRLRILLLEILQDFLILSLASTTMELKQKLQLFKKP